MMIINDLSVLKKRSRETSIEECQSLHIFEDLETSLKESERAGIGLTAVQIGCLIRCCVIRIKHESGKELNLNMINPVIEKKETPFIMSNEGCLSMPGIVVATDRYAEITCRWIDYDTKKEIRAYFGPKNYKEDKYNLGEGILEAVCIQQECDHMEGILITDREHKKVDKIGRNDLCPCGSGKKYKKCCLK